MHFLCSFDHNSNTEIVNSTFLVDYQPAENLEEVANLNLRSFSYNNRDFHVEVRIESPCSTETTSNYLLSREAAGSYH